MRAGEDRCGRSFSSLPPPSGHEPAAPARQRDSLPPPAHSFSPSRLWLGAQDAVGRSVAARASRRRRHRRRTTGACPPALARPAVAWRPPAPFAYAFWRTTTTTTLARSQPTQAGMRLRPSVRRRCLRRRHHHWCKRRRRQGRIVSRERFSCAARDGGGNGGWMERQRRVRRSSESRRRGSGCGSRCARRRRRRRWRRGRRGRRRGGRGTSNAGIEEGEMRQFTNPLCDGKMT